MKRGDKVIIDHMSLSKKGNPIKEMLGNLYNPAVHSLGDNTPEIIKRSKNGDHPTITGVVGNNYVNLIYSDGFECGVEKEYINN
jgi:hypothetical protein